MKKHILIFAASVLLGIGAGCNRNDSAQGVKEAYRLARKGQWDEAGELVEKRIREVPTDMDAAVLLGLCLEHTGKGNADAQNRALNYLRQACDAMPDRYDVQFIYGNHLLNARRYTDAYGPLKNAYELHLKESHTITQETQGTIKYALGMCCLRNNKFDDAIKYLEQAAKSNPYASWPEIQNDIAFACFYKGRYMDAMKYLDNAMKLDKKNAALAEKKKSEIIALKQKGTPEQVSKKQDELDSLKYNYPHVTGLNMAVACDYLSFKKFNPKNPEAFKQGAIGWYDYSSALYQALRKNASSASQKTAYNKTLASIEKRRTALKK